jgi:hypothetical protein
VPVRNNDPNHTALLREIMAFGWQYSAFPDIEVLQNMLFENPIERGWRDGYRPVGIARM